MYSELTPYGGHVPSRSEQRAINQIEGRGTLDRMGDTEETRRLGHRVELTAALTIRTMQRAADVSQARRDIAQGDPAVELELLPFQQIGFRRMAGHLDDLFRPY